MFNVQKSRHIHSVSIVLSTGNGCGSIIVYLFVCPVFQIILEFKKNEPITVTMHMNKKVI